MVSRDATSTRRCHRHALDAVPEDTGRAPASLKSGSLESQAD